MSQDKKKVRKKRLLLGKKSVAFLAQSVERAALNRAVVGSRPTGGVLFFKDKSTGNKEKEV